MTQMTLEFEAGLTQRHKSLRECMVARVYAAGLSNVADDLAKAPGNLSRELAGDSDRHFSVESFERYMDKSKDFTPIYYLIEKYLGDAGLAEGATLRRVESLMQEAVGLMVQSGVVKKPARR